MNQSINFCKDCRHFEPQYGAARLNSPHCRNGRARSGVDPVNGSPISLTCTHARKHMDLCGPHGAWFEPARVEPPRKTWWLQRLLGIKP